MFHVKMFPWEQCAPGRLSVSRAPERLPDSGSDSPDPPRARSAPLRSSIRVRHRFARAAFGSAAIELARGKPRTALLLRKRMWPARTSGQCHRIQGRWTAKSSTAPKAPDLLTEGAVEAAVAAFWIGRKHLIAGSRRCPRWSRHGRSGRQNLDALVQVGRMARIHIQGGSVRGDVRGRSWSGFGPWCPPIPFEN